MKKKLNKKGFTLAELLVVIAIIGVLVAIAIPVFGGATDKAEAAAEQANARAAYAEGMTNYLTTNATTSDLTIGGKKYTFSYTPGTGNASVKVEAVENNVKVYNAVYTESSFGTGLDGK